MEESLGLSLWRNFFVLFEGSIENNMIPYLNHIQKSYEENAQFLKGDKSYGERKYTSPIK